MFFLSACPYLFAFFSSHHLLATVYERRGDLQSARQHEKEAYTIYHNQVRCKKLCFCICCCLFVLLGGRSSFSHVKAGQESRATRESSEYLRNLMQPAESLQNGTGRAVTTDLTPLKTVCTLLQKQESTYL